jgi:2-oxo-4-hydroxy-4-carboxy-5-ureidoimidazoline decarboxylase
VNLDDMNSAPDAKAREALLACCGARTWVDQMLASRPFRDAAALHASAEAIWASLSSADWLEAYSQHPTIGSNADGWSRQEQSGMFVASRDTAETMRRANEEYQRKFGWIFIVCASGKSAEDMLHLLQQRLENDPAEELRIAASEQSKIMHLRLDKLLAE